MLFYYDADCCLILTKGWATAKAILIAMALARAVIRYTDRAMTMARPLVKCISRAMDRTMDRAMATSGPIVITIASWRYGYS